MLLFVVMFVRWCLLPFVSCRCGLLLFAWELLVVCQLMLFVFRRCMLLVVARSSCCVVVCCCVVCLLLVVCC